VTSANWMIPRARPSATRLADGMLWPDGERSVVAAVSGLRRGWWRTSICDTTGQVGKSEADRGPQRQQGAASSIVGEMQASEVPRAVVAAMSVASSLDLTVDHATVLQNSNKLTLRLLPCDVLARVAPVAHQVAQFEVELAQRLAESPVAALEPRVAPRVYQHDGFVVTLWT
jgi:hypothetical protein